ncbi:hypothetical protein FDX19_20970 [Citrobacter sp. wls619]|uniref:hypothetical protein n=1 Tax=Citrobacter sp. wls619 TaxID=2576432 RepID=UPI0010C966F6|nr:hypothetical protein [Citrobacter sp. wls619]TKV06447.1 hypothetical protein FDX19_20970 [Citrobacter sp. wls619]
MNSELTRDRIAQFANDPMMCVSDEVREIARIALQSFGNSEQLIKQPSNNQDSDGNASGDEIKQSSSNCPKCGGYGTYHCPQMLGTVECECTLTATLRKK